MKKLIIFTTVLLATLACSPKTYTIIQIADAQIGFDAAVINDLTFETECL